VRSRKRIVDGNWAVTFDFGPSPRRNRFAVDGPLGGGRVKVGSSNVGRSRFVHCHLL
jgi:hypothetical protein